MSDIQHAIRQFGDAIKEAEERQAGHLGEIRDGVRATGNDTRRRIRTQLGKLEKAAVQFDQAIEEIKVILEENESAENHIMAEIDGVRTVALAPPQLTHNQDQDNG